jgi:hypothetical protein
MVQRGRGETWVAWLQGVDYEVNWVGDTVSPVIDRENPPAIEEQQVLGASGDTEAI